MYRSVLENLGHLLTGSSAEFILTDSKQSTQNMS